MLRPSVRRLFRLAIDRPDLTDRDVTDEVTLHIELRAEQLVAEGWARDEAMAEARRRFGPSWDDAVRKLRRVRHSREEQQAMRERIDILGQDLRYAVRGLRRAPRFTASAILTLALGLGAATVVFSVVDHVVLRPLPFEDPDELFVVRERIAQIAHVYPTMSANAGHFLEWRRGCSACEGVAAVRPAASVLTGDGDPQRVQVVRASANLFPLLGVRPAYGRTFGEEEDVPGRDAVVLLTDAFWRRQFGADPSVLGRTITVGGAAMEVVGILPSRFRLPPGEALGARAKIPQAIDMFRPLALTPRERTTPGEFDYSVIARVRDGSTLAEARAQIDAIQADITARHPDGMQVTAQLTPLAEQVVGSAGRPMLLLLSAVVAVLLIVCVNLANLTLAHNAGRSRESAVRIALGAGGRRIARLALAQSLMLSLAGGALGLLFAYWGLRAVVATAPTTLPRIDEVQLDMRVFAMAALLSTIVGISVGALPALRLTRSNPADALRSGGRSATEGRGGHRRRAIFIGAQVALSTVLLMATGLLLTSFVRVMGVDRGFETERVLAFNVALPPGADATRRLQFRERSLGELAALPGVTSVAAASALPLEGDAQVDILSLERDPLPLLERPTASIRYVSPGYFATVGTPVLRGRAITPDDRGRRVVVVSERTAKTLWPGGDAIGKRLVPGSNDSIAEVVGIAADVRTSSLEAEGSLVVYLPYWQDVTGRITFLSRTSGKPEALTASARDVVRRIEPQVLITDIRTMEEVVAKATAGRRFQVTLLLIFAIMALVTASIGIFGVIAQSLAGRSTEMGVRMALGAQPADVHRIVLREGLAPTLAGLVLGAVATVALGRVFSSLLFEVRPTDPVTLLGVATLLGLVAVVSCVIPARRVTGTRLANLLRME